MIVSAMYLILILIFVPSIILFKQDDYIIKHDHASVEYYNLSILRNLELKNVKPNRTYRAYTISGELLHDLPDNNLFRVKLKAFKFANNVPSHKIFELDVGACDAVSKNRFGAAGLLLAGNVTKCPVKQGYYYVKDYNIDESNLPPFIPYGRYRVQLVFTYGSATMAKGSLYAEIIYKVKH